MALLLLAAGAAAAALTLMPTLERTGDVTLTNDATPSLELRLTHPFGIDATDVDASIDGERVAANAIEVRDGGALIAITAPRLAEGDHDVRVSVEDAGLLRTTVTERWKLTVDTRPPAATIVEPVRASAESNPYLGAGAAAVTSLPLQLVVEAEAGATLSVASDARDLDPITSTAGDARRHSIEVPLPEGAQQLTVVARDAAGNESTRTLDVVVDTTGPALMVRAPRVVGDATLGLPVAGRDAHGVTISATLDGRPLEDAFDLQGEPAATGDDDVAPVAARGSLTLPEPAFEGRHVLEVVATDAFGTTTTTRRTFVVDSSEELASVSGLRIGARGADVVQLQEALLDQEVVGRDQLAAELRSRTFGEQTRAAVQAFQQRQGMSVDGVAGADTIAGLTLKIVIDRSSNTLTLYRSGAVAKTYPIATGSPEYPTPAGEFRIHDKQRNPTWTPPDSDWAKDAKPIPPGPDNPLGTRWMRIGGAVGIHGTNNPASLGYSVSHGCIRMSIPDVEELFEIVPEGTPVVVV